MSRRSRCFKSWMIRRVLLVALGLYYATVLWRMQRRLEDQEETARRPSFPLDRLPPPPPKSSVHKVSSDYWQDENNLAQPTDSYIIDSNDLWEYPTTKLPIWMKSYFRWHKQQTQTQNQPQSRYLIASCLESYPKCGGLADRLYSLPFLVKVAAHSQRILLLQWGRPAPLEDFLLPPAGGVNWRVPTFLLEQEKSNPKRKNQRVASTEEVILQMAAQPDRDVVRVKFQAHDHGQVFYDSHLLQQQPHEHEPDFATVFGDLWHCFFTPPVIIQQQLTTYLQHNGLIPGHYVATHFRALYNVQQRDDRLVRFVAQNAINCTLQQRGAATEDGMYFASDSAFASQAAVEYGADRGVLVIARHLHETNNPLHLDKTRDWKQRPSSDFYDTIVDLYLLSMARCVLYGMGGYGKMASLLSADPSCAMQHHAAVGVTRCPLDKKHPTTTIIISPGDQPNRPTDRRNDEDSLFRPPMAERIRDNAALKGDERRVMTEESDTTLRTVSTGTTNSSNGTPLDFDLAHPEPLNFPPRLESITPITSTSTSTALWEYSTRLPQWMKDYFAWHRQQRELLTPDNWKDFRFIVMVCMKRDSTCGGTADRLRPLPVVVRIAAETKRILLIQWEKPMALENFLVPPVGGLDWRTPDWLSANFRGGSERMGSVEKLVHAATNHDNRIVKAKLQVSDYGNKYYSQQGLLLGEPEDSLRQHYRDLWYTFFTPAPPLAGSIESEMQRMHLFPGEFSYAHVRAQYGIEEKGRDLATIQKWAVNSLNCLSHLRPGGPFYFASDSAYAREAAIQYGKEKNALVATRMEEKDPLHLDMVKGNESRAPSDYYSVFIDLYIMSFGVCMTYNVGGFGKWGLLLSGRHWTCNVRHWTAGVAKRLALKDGCKWKEASDQTARSAQLQRKLELPLFLPPM